MKRKIEKQHNWNKKNNENIWLDIQEYPSQNYFFLLIHLSKTTDKELGYAPESHMTKSFYAYQVDKAHKA